MQTCKIFADTRTGSVVPVRHCNSARWGRLFGCALVGAITVAIIPNGRASGELDSTFSASVDNPLRAIAVQPSDGKVIIGGDFTYVNGTYHPYLARLNANGTLDAGFASYGPNGPVHAIAIQPDGKVLVGGAFTNIYVYTRGRLARLDSSGNVDTTFVDPAYENTVRSIFIQPDWHVLVSGDFIHHTIYSTYQYYVSRLFTDGTIDYEFFPPYFNGPIRTVSASGPYVAVGGQFTFLANVYRTNIALLNANGTVFSLFNPGQGPNWPVNAVIMKSPDEIFLGGAFYTPRQRVLEMEHYGVVIGSLGVPGGPNDEVRALALDASGRVLVGGRFTSVDGCSTCQKISRIDPSSGYPETGFGIHTFGPIGCTVEAIALQSDGKIIIGGTFTSMDGGSRLRLARLLP